MGIPDTGRRADADGMNIIDAEAFEWRREQEAGLRVAFVALSAVALVLAGVLIGGALALARQWGWW